MLEAPPFEFVGELCGGALHRQIGPDHGRFDPDPAQFVGQFPQRLDAARAEHEIMAVPGQFACQRGADAARCAGDEGQGAAVAARPVLSLHGSGSAGSWPHGRAGDASPGRRGGETVARRATAGVHRQPGGAAESAMSAGGRADRP